ncbi:MAG: GAF domain-containing protein [Cyanobacteria bacterium J06633_2]
MTSHQDDLSVVRSSAGDRPPASGSPVSIHATQINQPQLETAPYDTLSDNAVNGLDAFDSEPSQLIDSTDHRQSGDRLPQSLPSQVHHLEAQSHRLLASLHPTTLAVEWANNSFLAISEQVSLHETDSDIAQLCAFHRLYRLIQAIYPHPLPQWRLLDEPIIVRICSSGSRSRYIQTWLRSDALQFTIHQSVADVCLSLDLADLDLTAHDPLTWQAIFNDSDGLNYRCRQLLERLTNGALSCAGSLFLEGFDITAQESIRRITQLLVDQNSVLQLEKFEQVNAQMCELFRADNTAIVCFQRRKVRLFMGDVSDELNVAEYSFDDLQGGQMMEAIANRRIMIEPDLQDQCFTELGQRLLALGVRSLLLIPLMAEHVTCGHHAQNPIGLVGVLSRTPHQFDAVDHRRAEQLMPAFTAALSTALRQMYHRQFINSIHPSVEWRFIQEAERRSLGMMPEPIVFQHVFPLYGISDIRGSSQERNRAIQSDLLKQLRLGLAIVEALCEVQAGTFVEQLRLDVLDKITELEHDITVGAEVTISRYLSDRLEVHFENFANSHPVVKPVIETYQKACHPQQGGVYHARAHYDFLLGQITNRLRTTWDEWQENMQQVIPHYCDVEVTDGIDHMIYAGAAIAAQFSPFYLQSLRYEQLRAVCACAQTAFDIQAEFDSPLEVTHLVLVQDSTVDIFHDEDTERLFDVRGTRDTRYEIVKKRIDKAVDADRKTRITQPGMLTIVYSTEQEEEEYREYLRYLVRERWIKETIQTGDVEPLQGVSGLKFMRVSVLPRNLE